MWSLKFVQKNQVYHPHLPNSIYLEAYLKSCKCDELLFSAVELVVKDGPLGLLIDLIDAYHVMLNAQIVESVVFESELHKIVLFDVLLHQ